MPDFSFSELFRGFQRFSELFQRPSQRPSQSAIFLSELRVVLPLIVLPLKTPAIFSLRTCTPVKGTPCSTLSGPVLRDTASLSQRYPPIARYGVFSVSTWPIGCDTPPPPFLRVSPLESMRSGGAIPPPKRGISAILARYPMKTRQTGAIPPSAILSRKGIAR